MKKIKIQAQWQTGKPMQDGHTKYYNNGKWRSI